MTDKEQIEEMARDLENHTCMSQFQAEIASRMLYIKDYRKASEVAREIFEEIEKSLCVHTSTTKTKEYADGASDTIEWVDSKIEEVKKKYTEGKG